MIRQGWFRAEDAEQVAVAPSRTALAAHASEPFLGRCFEWATLGTAALIVAAVLVDALHLAVTPLWVGSAAVLMLLPLVYLAVRQAKRLGRRFDLLSDLALLGIIVMLGWQLLAPAWPSLLPIGNSPDAVHHTALANYILEQRQLVRDPEAASQSLIEMAEYPPGFAVLAALAARLGNVMPLQVIYPLAALTTAAAVLGCALLIMASVGAAVRPIAGLAALLTLLLPGYVIGAVAQQNYYPQMLAQWLLLAIAYVATQHHGRQAWPRLALLLLALLVSYTTWLPVALLALTLSLLTQHGAWSQRLRSIALLPVPIALLALAYSWSRASTGGSVIMHEGSTIRDPLGTIGVWLPILALLGLLTIRKQSRRLPAFWLLLAALAHTAGLWLLWQRGMIAGYIYYKSYYLLALLLPVPIGWLLGDTLRRALGRWSLVRWRWVTLQPVVLLALVVGAATLPLLPSTSSAESHPISPSLLQAAAWVRAHGAPDDVAYGLKQPGLPAYWLHVGVLSQPRTQTAQTLLEQPSASYFEWYFHPASTRFLLLEQSSLPQPNDGLAIRFQNECCMVLEKTDEYAAALHELRPLMLSYSMTLKQGRSQVDLELFDALDQADLRLRLLLQGAEQPLAAYTIDLPQRSGRVQYLGVSFDPQTLAATGYLNNEPGLEWPASRVEPPPNYRVRLQLLKRDDLLREVEIAGCCAAPERREPELFQPHGAWIVYRPPQRTAAPSRDLTLGQQIGLIDARLGQTILQPGQTLDVALRWQSRATIDRRYTTFVQLIADDGGAAVSVEGEPNQSGTPTWRWQSGDLIDDRWQLSLPPDLKPGSYHVVVGMYDPATGQRLEAWQQSPSLERFWTNALPLGTVEVRP